MARRKDKSSEEKRRKSREDGASARNVQIVVERLIMDKCNKLNWPVPGAARGLMARRKNKSTNRDRRKPNRGGARPRYVQKMNERLSVDNISLLDWLGPGAAGSPKARRNDKSIDRVRREPKEGESRDSDEAQQRKRGPEPPSTAK